MSLEQARYVLPFIARDLVVAIGAREEFDNTLEPFARRRQPAYAPSAPQEPERYWPTIAAALAPVGAPQWMPMHGLIDGGTTLEGGARGLRGLFTREPSEKERRKVLKTATLTARVLRLVLGNVEIPAEQQRLFHMTMNSFGLSEEEREQANPTRAVTFDSLELLGEVDIKVRRELLRGAWTLALAGKIDPQVELAVRGIAQKLELSQETDAIRSELMVQAARRAETAALAVELVRIPARALDPEVAAAWIEHLIEALAPAPRRNELLELAHSEKPARFADLPRLDGDRRHQAVAAALATLLGHDPPMSIALHLRTELAQHAAQANAGGDVKDAFAVVDRYLAERLEEICFAPPAEEPAAAPPTPQTPPAERPGMPPNS